MKKHLFLIFTAWLLCFVTLNVNATLTAHLDRNQITQGETVQLIIEATGQTSTMPSTQALNEDFDVMGMISGSRLNIINGNIDSRTSWTITLAPKRSGELTIPPLTINGEQTPTLFLQVSETSAGLGPDTDTPVFIETEVDKTDPYVQGMVRYTMRVFFAVNLVQGSLSEPEPENAFVHRLGEDREYQAMHDGRPYHVIEREFIIFPQTSGNLMIPGPVLDAQIPENISQRDSFFDRMFANNRPIRLRGETVTLEVRPRPNQSTSQYWLPAESVELLEDWQPENGKIAVGDPLTRNITIKALGVTGEQLPDLEFTDINGFKLYPDRAQSNTQNLQHNIQGEKTLRLAYMPTQPGTYTLPEFTLHWWDTRTNQERTTTLAARSIEVIPGASQPQNASTQTPRPAVNPNENTMQQSAQMDDVNPLFTDRGATTSPLDHNAWFWTSLVFAALWLITLGLMWRRRHFSPQHTDQKKTPAPETGNSRKARKLFLSACQANDAQQARHYLLKWAADHWLQSPPKGLEDLALRLNDPAISAALITLDRMLYQGNNENWDGQELAKLLTKLPQQNSKSADKNVLPGLYAKS
jgi:oxygen tolerance protein BatD